MHFSHPELYIYLEKMSLIDEHGLVIPIIEWPNRKITVDAIHQKIKKEKRMMRSHLETVNIGGVKLAANQLFFDYKIVNRKYLSKLGLTENQIQSAVKKREPIEI